MCLQCPQFSYFVGNCFYVLERLVQCTALTALVSCLVATLLVMMGMGIGLGYNYCVVDRTMKIPKAPVKCVRRSGDENDQFRQLANLRRSGQSGPPRTLNNTFVTPRITTTERTPPPAPSTTSSKPDTVADTTPELILIEPTMRVPLQHTGLLALIMKLKEKKDRNFTLELTSL